MAESGEFHVKRFNPTEPAERDIAAEKSAFLAKIRERATKRKNEAISAPEVCLSRPPEVSKNDEEMSEISTVAETESEAASNIDAVFLEGSKLLYKIWPAKWFLYGDLHIIWKPRI